MRKEFFNLYNHNFIRACVAVPEIHVADPSFNALQTIALTEQAAERQAMLVVFPELGLSGYSCEDLFHQQTLLDSSQQALEAVLAASSRLPVIVVVGIPLQVNGLLFNCAAISYGGEAPRCSAKNLSAELPRVLRDAPVHAC